MKGIYLLLGASLLFAACQQDQQSSNSQTTETETANQVTSESYSPLTVGCKYNKLDAQKGGEILYDDGSKLSFSPNSFVDADGRAIEGEVEIKYTVFNKASEIIASDLPMHIDTEDGLGVFESAGMFNVEATHNGKEVYLAEGKSADIVTKSNKEGDFNFYQLGEEDKWIEINNQIQSQEQTTEVSSIKESMDDLDIAKPIKPRKASGDRMVFDLKIEQKLVPELAQFENLLWELDEGQSNKDWLFESQWDNLKIENEGGDGLYRITINQKGNKADALVRPVLMGKDYKLALQNYEQQMQNYQTALDNRVQPQVTNLNPNQGGFFRTASLTNFGTYNWDRLMKQPRTLLVDGEFFIDGNRINEGRVIHMVTGADREVVNFRPGKSNFRFSPEVSNTLIYIDQDSMIFTYDIDMTNTEIREIRRNKTMNLYLNNSGVKAYDLETIQNFIDQV